MGDVTGPISTLPGAVFAAEPNAVCDAHPDRQSVRRVQGETDSFGSEMIDMCQECLDEFREHQKQARVGVCDLCERKATDLRPRRDFEEGQGGPVYDVCGACVKRQNEELRREAAEYDEDERYEY